MRVFADATLACVHEDTAFACLHAEAVCARKPHTCPLRVRMNMRRACVCIQILRL